MEYDPCNFDLIEEYKKNKVRDEYSRIKKQKQNCLSDLDPTIDYDKMNFVVTLRNATDYYEYNGCVYGCYMCEEWELESTNAKEWINRVKLLEEEINQKESECMKKKLGEQMISDSYARLSGNEINPTEIDSYKLKPKGKPSIWLQIKRNLIPEKYRTYEMYPEHVLVFQTDK